MSDDNQQGAGKQALDSDVLAARAAEQRERDAAAQHSRNANTTWRGKPPMPTKKDSDSVALLSEMEAA